MLEYGMGVLLYCKMLEVGMRYVICLEVVLILVDCVLYIKLFVMLFWFWIDDYLIVLLVLLFIFWFVLFWVLIDWFVVIIELVLLMFVVMFWFGCVWCIWFCICWLGINGIWELEFLEFWFEDMVIVVRWFSRWDWKLVLILLVFFRYWLILLVYLLNLSWYLFILDIFFLLVVKMIKNKIIYVYVYV